MQTKLLKNNLKVSFIYTELAFAKMRSFMNTTHAKTNEFMFLGLAKKKKVNENITYTMEDVFLVPQICRQTFCETDDDRYPEWFQKNIKLEDRKNIRVHAHSHVNMATNPSGVDNKQIEDLYESVSDFFIQLIINHNNRNTVNILDKQLNLKFEHVEQYLLLNKTLIKIQNNGGFDIKSIKIKDKCKFYCEGNSIKLNKILYYDLEQKECYAIGEHLLLTENAEMHSVELDKQAEKDIKELTKLSHYGGEFNGFK